MTISDRFDIDVSDNFDFGRDKTIIGGSTTQFQFEPKNFGILVPDTPGSSSIGGTKFDPSKIEVFDTGAQRSSGKGKGRFDLIPTGPERRVALKYEEGAIGYGENNWKKGMKFSRLFDSTKRHINQFMEGDRSEDHLAAAVWNLFAVMYFEEKMPEMNDLYEQPYE